MRRPVSQEAIAYHEAGHALISSYYRRAVYGVTLGEPDAAGQSLVRFGKTPHVDEIYSAGEHAPTLWPKLVAETLITVRIRFAGPLAQAIFEDIHYRNIEGGKDFEDAIYDLLFLEKTRISIPALKGVDYSYRTLRLTDNLAEETIALLRAADNFKLLRGLAEQLLIRRELAEAEVDHALRDLRRFRP